MKIYPHNFNQLKQKYDVSEKEDRMIQVIDGIQKVITDHNLSVEETENVFTKLVEYYRHQFLKYGEKNSGKS